MNVLLVYPRLPETFWSFTYALRFIKKKAAFGKNGKPPEDEALKEVPRSAKRRL